MSLHSIRLPPARSLTVTDMFIALKANREATPSRPFPGSTSWSREYSTALPNLYLTMLSRSCGEISARTSSIKVTPPITPDRWSRRRRRFIVARPLHVTVSKTQEMAGVKEKSNACLDAGRTDLHSLDEAGNVPFGDSARPGIAGSGVVPGGCQAT